MARKRSNLFCARDIIYDPLAAGESSGKINLQNFGLNVSSGEVQIGSNTWAGGRALGFEPPDQQPYKHAVEARTTHFRELIERLIGGASCGE